MTDFESVAGCCCCCCCCCLTCALFPNATGIQGPQPSPHLRKDRSTAIHRNPPQPLTFLPDGSPLPTGTQPTRVNGGNASQCGKWAGESNYPGFDLTSCYRRPSRFAVTSAMLSPRTLVMVLVKTSESTGPSQHPCVSLAFGRSVTSRIVSSINCILPGPGLFVMARAEFASIETRKPTKSVFYAPDIRLEDATEKFILALKLIARRSDRDFCGPAQRMAARLYSIDME
jgi:hypothetical protein